MLCLNNYISIAIGYKKYCSDGDSCKNVLYYLKRTELYAKLSIHKSDSQLMNRSKLYTNWESDLVLYKLSIKFGSLKILYIKLY